MKKRYASLLAALLLVGCDSGGPAPESARRRILPGQSVDAVRLGETKAEVEKALGAPEDVDRNEFAPKSSFDLYYSKGLEVDFFADQVQSITCHNTGERWTAYPGATAEGLWVGSRKADFEKTFGAPKKTFSQALKYVERGLQVQFDKDGKVSALVVHRPGTEQ